MKKTEIQTLEFIIKHKGCDTICSECFYDMKTIIDSYYPRMVCPLATEMETKNFRGNTNEITKRDYFKNKLRKIKVKKIIKEL